MTPKYLFIGGPNDGKRMCIPDNQFCVRTLHNAFPPAQRLQDDSKYFAVEEHTYRLVRCSSLEIYVHQSIPSGKVTEALVKGYHRFRRSNRISGLHYHR